MAERMANLDPALESASSTGRFVGTAQRSVDSYRQDAAQSTPTYPPSQSTPQPYYQYQPPPTQSNASASTSTLPSPSTHVYNSSTPGALISRDSADGTESAQQNGQDDSKRPRACEACRGLKVRCDQDPTRPDVPCKRCAKAGRSCIITQPSRKRQKKADSKVAELEKKLDALTAVLNHRHSTGAFGTSAQMPGAEEDTDIGSPPHAVGFTLDIPDHSAAAAETQRALKRRRTEDGAVGISSPDKGSDSDAGGPFAKDIRQFLNHRNADDFSVRITALIPLAHGSELFARYNNEMITHLPFVVFQEEVTAEQVFKEKPILYLAIMAAASFGVVPPEVSLELQNETMGAIADCVVRSGAKSLELIQAMQIVALWYKPPENAERTNFYQIVHMAAVMALDIGLGKRYNPRKPRHALGKRDVIFVKVDSQNSDSLEARRAWLGCYYLCATASMVLRRPNLVRWTTYMKECIEVLETSAEALPSDKLLCQHVRIQHICEEIGMRFLMDDCTAQVSINDPKVTYALNVLEGQLKTWKQEIPPQLTDSSLVFFEHVTSLYLHEIALHFNHNIDDFRVPFTEESLKNVNSSSDALTQNQVVAIDACLKAAHGILTSMIQFTLEELLALPMLVFFVRCIYALVILIKMHVAITTPGSELGKLMKAEDLKIEYFLVQLIKLFDKVAYQRDAKPEKISRILGVLNDWFERHKSTLGTRQSGIKAAQDPPQPPNGAARTQETSTAKDDESNHTPLQMLSNVATGQQQNNNYQNNGQRADWTIDSPYAMNFRRVPAEGEAKFPPFQQPSQENATDMAGATSAPYDNNMLGLMDPSIPAQDYGWGSGFEQAMDMTLGHMGDLQGDALNNWFLGKNVAPFGFGDFNTMQTAPVGGQWQ